MANMGYCRFTNTLEDLQDCFEHLEDEDLSEPEQESRKRLLTLCAQIVAQDIYESDPDACPACRNER